MARKGNVVVGLDLGTTKTCVIVGKVNDTGGLDIVASEAAPPTGLRKGVVVNIDNTDGNRSGRPTRKRNSCPTARSIPCSRHGGKPHRGL
jgi:molecular chaperone DnaK (HSP70)